jgi:RNA-directed DNA polymerase
MKRFSGVLAAAATVQNVLQAFHKARRGCRDQCASRQFEKGLEREVSTLVFQMSNGTWEPAPFRKFVVFDPKRRLIHAADFRDRVLHHAVFNTAGPCLESGAIDQSFACRVGRGNRAAVEYVRRCSSRFQCFLKLDIRRYFDSVDHHRLLALLDRRFRDVALVRIFDRMISHFEHTPGSGLPIGTLSSQYFANFFLDGFDHWVRASLRCHGYARYMDDFVVFHDNPDTLRVWEQQIEHWLLAHRGLQLKQDRHTGRSSDGIPFLGYRIKAGRVLLARRSRRRFVLRLRQYMERFLAGRLTEQDLQRRLSAVLSFLLPADCDRWRHRVVSNFEE